MKRHSRTTHTVHPIYILTREELVCPQVQVQTKASLLLRTAILKLRISLCCSPSRRDKPQSCVAGRPGSRQICRATDSSPPVLHGYRLRRRYRTAGLIELQTHIQTNPTSTATRPARIKVVTCSLIQPSDTRHEKRGMKEASLLQQGATILHLP